ncbi:MAG: MFS transporter [Rhodospirillales bacterium]|jgi:MFS transporter, DHA1 family, tetracycline resistance protein|nr:MFS transporter [Rhodospirillales bacterium]
MFILFLIVFIDLLGFGIIIPLLPFYAEHFDAAPYVVTLVLATYSLAQLFSATWWGGLSDRIGRRPVLIASLAGAVVSYVWLGFADTLWMLFATRALGGFMAGNISAAFAYVADSTTPENRARGMGMIGAGYGLGFFVGPAIGGILAGPDALNADYQTPAFAAAGLSFVSLCLAIAILKESLSDEIRARVAARPKKSMMAQLAEASRNRNLTYWIGLMFLATFVMAGMETTFAMWAERGFGWGPRHIGFVLAFVGLLSILIQGGMIGRLTRWFGERALVVQGALVLSISFFFLPFAQTPPVLLLVMAGLAYGFSVITPALNSLISLEAEPEGRGGTLGVSRSASIFARVVGPAFAGVLFSTLGRHAPYFVSAAIMLTVFFLALQATRFASKRQKEGE